MIRRLEDNIMVFKTVEVMKSKNDSNRLNSDYIFKVDLHGEEKEIIFAVIVNTLCIFHGDVYIGACSLDKEDKNIMYIHIKKFPDWRIRRFKKDLVKLEDMLMQLTGKWYCFKIG
jgi:hypothetical protein